MRKTFFAVSGAALLMATAATEARATPTLRLQNGSSFVQIQDGGSNDANPLAGVVGYYGGLGNYFLNVSTGISVNGINFIDLNSVNMSSSSSPTTLLLGFSESGFNSAAPLPYNFQIGGITNGSISYAAYLDTSNTLFGHGTLIGSGTGTNLFSYESPEVLLDTSSPYSLSEFISITHNGPYRLTSFDAKIAPVPEPHTMMLLGSGLFGIAVYGKRRQQKDAAV